MALYGNNCPINFILHFLCNFAQISLYYIIQALWLPKIQSAIQYKHTTTAFNQIWPVVGFWSDHSGQFRSEIIILLITERFGLTMSGSTSTL